MYVIQNIDTDKFVCPAGSEHSYTNKLQDARRFPTYESARKECCGNERPVAVEDILLP